MITYLVSNVSKGGNYLLNIGPKANGEFPVPAVRRLREIGAWLYANNEAVYGSYPVKTEQVLDKDVLLTQKIKDGKTLLYVTLTKEKPETTIPFKFTKVYSCKSLEMGMPVKYKINSDSITLEIPKEIFIDSFPVVIEIETDNMII